MDLYLAGGLHADPTGIEQLIAWMTELRADHGEDPAFIAVEWDRGTMSRALREAERSKFRECAGGLWGDSCDPEVAARLSLVVAWEVDAHRVIFPNLAPIFLDPFERGTHRGMNGPLYFQIIRQRLEGYAGDRFDVEAILRHVHQREVAAAPGGLADASDRNKGRDDRWADIIQHEVAHHGGWGIAVIGAWHASKNHPATCRQLLTSRGVAIANVKFLGYEPPEAPA